MRRVDRRGRMRAVSIAYGALAVAGAVAPSMVPKVFGGSAPTAASRTEIRTVYTGIPVAFATLLGWESTRPDPSPGVVDTVAAATGAMGLVRLGSSAVEKRIDPWPTGTFAAIELAMALALLRRPTRRGDA